MALHSRMNELKNVAGDVGDRPARAGVDVQRHPA